MKLLQTSDANPEPVAVHTMVEDSPSFFKRNSERFLVLTILVVVAGVFHWTPYKLAFLNFFYIPVLAAVYLLGSRRALLISVLCVLMIFAYYFWFWAGEAFVTNHDLSYLLSVPGQNRETLLSLFIWGLFLIVTGGAFAGVYEKLEDAFKRARQQSGELLTLNQRLGDSSAALEVQTEELQQKNLQIEHLKGQLEQIVYSTMDPTVARLIIQGRLRQEKRNISVLFCDLKGFTSYALTPGPEVILEDLNQFYGVMEEYVENYHGHIDKYMGDGIMCEFGAPIDHEQHSLEAVICALKMHIRFTELCAQMKWPWKLRIGIASGEAIVGLLGKRRRSYSALGEIVNIAKRLEELAPPGSVLLDETTSDAVRPWVEVRPYRSQGGRRTEDKQLLEAIAEKEQQLQRDPQNPELLFYIGLLYFRMREASSAVGYFQRALEFRPDDKEIKALYADASLKRDEYEKITIRGLGEKRAVFEALTLMDPLVKRERFPKAFYDRYHHVVDWFEIPDHVTLSAEVIDASVGHSRCVAVVAYAIADRMGLSEEAKQDLLVAARLQDMGKSVVWHYVLNRRGGISDQERKDLEAHVAESVSVAKRMGYDRPGVIDVIANHHELLDGTGYPRRVKGNEIPVGARISCIADIYSALTAWRPYRNAWDIRVALSELHKGATAGKYDLKVVDTLQELMT